MIQQNAPPTPAAPQAPGDAGRALGEAINGIVKNALQSAAIELRAQVEEAIAKRDAIQAQLDAATSSSQRRALQAQLDKANANIDKLTEGLNKLESKTGKTPTAPPARQTTSSTNQPPSFPPPDEVPTTMIISVVSIIFIGFPLSIAFARLLWRRATHIGAPAQTAQMSAEQGHRFDRLEHAVDAVAIEIERISENQRYLTKVLAEGQEKKLTG